MDKYNIAIVLPINWDFLPIQFFQSFIQFKMPCKWSVIISNRGRIDDLRNSAIFQVLKEDCFSHILFLDIDHYHHPDTIVKLLTHNLPVVSGLSFRRSEPYDPIMFKWEDEKYRNITTWPKDSLVEVDAVGGASLLVKTSVFKDINKPYFEFTKYNGGTVSEDITFCRKLKEAGYKIYCDTSCTNDHIGTLNVNEMTWRNYNNANNGE